MQSAEWVLDTMWSELGNTYYASLQVLVAKFLGHRQRRLATCVLRVAGHVAASAVVPFVCESRGYLFRERLRSQAPSQVRSQAAGRTEFALWSLTCVYVYVCLCRAARYLFMQAKCLIKQGASPEVTLDLLARALTLEPKNVYVLYRLHATRAKLLMDGCTQVRPHAVGWSVRSIDADVWLSIV